MLYNHRNIWMKMFSLICFWNVLLVAGCNMLRNTIDYASLSSLSPALFSSPWDCFPPETEQSLIFCPFSRKCQSNIFCIPCHWIPSLSTSWTPGLLEWQCLCSWEHMLPLLLSYPLISAKTAFPWLCYIPLPWGSQAQRVPCIRLQTSFQCHSSTVVEMYAAFLTTFISSSKKKSIILIPFQCSPSFWQSVWQKTVRYNKIFQELWN